MSESTSGIKKIAGMCSQRFKRVFLKEQLNEKNLLYKFHMKYFGVFVLNVFYFKFS